ncbi:FHA domain-containing protein [Microbacterium sp. T2.11-28]|uniref:FHA domain-containing protein n=1 Tax=Microbacterium sp. T2.11-28 TaxID=3041169 RepID=UPI002477A2E2|nr:FHA domain-containing protein [Microbacterium sp. T2.11-28]CAI9390564.1 hypothetical protein MICABA_01502 [Microbacterium sp. T2.11-28]
MSDTIDTSLAPLVGLLAFVIGIALYVWMSLALSAMFRKMGEEAWKGWVPLLNQATVLKWGGFSPLLILLLLVPIAGPVIVLVLLVISAHRINPGFGYGTGMTVLSALLFVVWASILGFGPAPWRGARPSVAPASAPPSSAGMPPAPPRPPLPPTSAAYAAAVPGAAAGFPPVPPVPTSFPAAPPAPPAAFAAADPLAAQPVVPPAPVPAGWAPPQPGAASRGSADDAEPDVAAWPSEIDDVSAVSPSPFPPSAAATAGPRRASAPEGAQVTPPAPADEVPGLISFVPGRRSEDAEPVTRMPVTAPIETPLPSRAAARAEADDAFPELSGEVSAVVGSPIAGTPLSARSSVAAQQRAQQHSDLPDAAPASAVSDDGLPDEDETDQTVMVRRKKITWQLVPASSSPVPLTADVVVLGRRPAADPSFPQAQLIAVQDDARTVSKTHARLELRGEKWLVTDLGSTNGVLVRTLMGEEVEVEPGTELEAGERFFLGDEEFHLQHD